MTRDRSAFGAEGPRTAALYLRVSTKDQTTENQRPELERMAAMRQLEVVCVFEEKGSAWSARPAFRAMLEAARRGDFGVILVWALDRFGRSMVGNMNDVLELDRIGVRVVSVRESWLDTSGPKHVRDLLLAIFSWIAEQETAHRSARTKAGLERARREGKRLGRAPARLDLRRATLLRGEGMSIRDIADELGVARSVVFRALKRP